MNTQATPRRAIVMGASMAGLLAARVLAERFDEVVLLERDELPEGAAPRKGTPQAVQPHALLARGQQVIETLLPGFTDALLAQGGLTGDIGQDAAFDASGQRLVRSALGITGVLASRLAIEAEIRRQVRLLPNVRFMTGVDVLTPVHEDGRVTGVRWQPHGGSDAGRTLAAALVVDCTGRGSRSPAWLREWGYEAPPEERVTIGLAYTNAYFRRDDAERPSPAVVIGAATPSQPRPSILIAQEPDAEGRARWVVGVGGYAGDHVATTREAMAERARATGQHEIAELAERGELIGEVMRYGMPHSQRRHFERLARFPEGYLAMGDAIASFNPIYGQGMTVAACEALALRETLKRGTKGLARRFFKAAARVIDTPWQLAVGGDLALPVVQGPRPFPVKLINAYVGRVQRVAVHDAVVAGAFLKVVHLLAKPESLFAPGIVWRVWRGAQQQPGQGAPQTATA
jgi:2-polyprenyl-6-methoxyphenol hydroxylase-like FAD-dependent oxidoreductase